LLREGKVYTHTGKKGVKISAKNVKKHKTNRRHRTRWWLSIPTYKSQFYKFEYNLYKDYMVYRISYISPRKQGYLARDGRIIDASLIPAPVQRNCKQEQDLAKQQAADRLETGQAAAKVLQILYFPAFSLYEIFTDLRVH
jgi:hypothetical protein